MPELLESTKKLLGKYQYWHQSPQLKPEGATISVDEVASRVASFYEKAREVIDWREEHLLRRTAIERVLKRRFFMKKNGQDIAEPLIQELIRGGHFPNDSIPEEKISDVQKMIDKYVFITENAPEPPQKERMKMRLYDWILAVAACEMEEILAPPIKEGALMEFMLEQMKDKIQLKENGKVISEEEKNTQIYIAVQRALFKLDIPLISYNLLKKWHPQWTRLPEEEIKKVAGSIYSLWDRIEKSLNHPLGDKFYEICERKDTPYLILGDIIGENPEKAPEYLENPDVLENKIREAYRRRLNKVKTRIKRAAVYSTLSIFLTKMLVALAVEVPFDRYLTDQFSYFTIGLNILIPPMLMFFLVLSIHPPSKKNEELVVMEVIKITYGREKNGVYEIRPAKERGAAYGLTFGFLYFLSFAATFGFIFWALSKLNFSIVSIAIFIMFVSLISFAGVKIRKRAKELVVEKEKDTFLRTLFDLFSLPVIQVGKWLSGQWAKYNAMAVLFNSLLDMPFQMFVEFLEQWRSFLKEKKEKIH
jgi:hypothetical protein